MNEQEAKEIFKRCQKQFEKNSFWDLFKENGDKVSNPPLKNIISGGFLKVQCLPDHILYLVLVCNR